MSSAARPAPRSRRSAAPMGRALAVALLVATGASAQVVSNPNQIDGRAHFTNVNPEILSALAAGQGIVGAYVTSRSQPPAPATSASQSTPGGSGGEYPFELTVESSAAGVVHSVGVWPYLDAYGVAAGFDRYYFRRVLSDPVFPEPAADVPLDVPECAGDFHIRFVDSGGAPAAPAAASFQARRYDLPGPTGYALMANGEIAPGQTEDHLLALGDGGTYRLWVSVQVGSDPAADLVKVEIENDLALSCDQVVDVPIPLPSAGPGGGGVALGRVVGRFDVLGEEEDPVTPSADPWRAATRAWARFGPWSNERVTLLPRSMPSSGDFALENLVPSDVIAPPDTYDVGADASMRRGDRTIRLTTPAISVTVPEGGTLDLGDTFVMEPAFVTGRIELVGPAEPAVTRTPLGSLKPYPAPRPDGVLDLFTLTSYPHVLFNAGIWGRVTTAFRAAYSEPAAALLGDYESLVASPAGSDGTWCTDRLVLEWRNTDAGTPDREWLDGGLELWDRAAGCSVRTPGATETFDWSACFSTLEIGYFATSGTIRSPEIVTGTGTLVGPDWRGRATDRYVRVQQHRGRVAPSATSGTVVLTVPEGSYSLTPTVVSIAPSGQETRQTLEVLNLDVGCGLRYRVHPDLLVQIATRLPDCPAAGTLAVTGSVTSEADIASVTGSVNGGPDVVACTACGISPPFACDVDVAAGHAEITVKAVDSVGNEASTTLFANVGTGPAEVSAPGAMPLTVARAGTDLVLGWEPLGGVRFHVHQGTIASLHALATYDHVPVAPCWFDAATATIPSPAQDAYYLVTAHCSSEGSLGRSSLGAERPATTAPCW